MRHLDFPALLVQILATDEGKKAKAVLDRAIKKLENLSAADRIAHIRRNGPTKWRLVKDLLTDLLGKKCWYTEVIPTGAPLTMDHYRPVHQYWWLAYEPGNYRVSCQWANSPEHNANHGCAGGKGDNFPLLPPALRATANNRLQTENPVILDPCNAGDCAFVAFQADGRPVLNPDFSDDEIARFRVEQSMLLLNLDHADFNSEREQLCVSIAQDVRVFEALPINSAERAIIRTRLEERLAPNAPFSTAAHFYLKLHRHLDWVQNILDAM